MRYAAPARLAFLALAAACWLAAGPGGVPIQAAIACQHHALHQPLHAGHPAAPTDGPCFCDEMSRGLDLAVSAAVPAPVVAAAILTPSHDALPPLSPFPLPHSPSFAPESPPPDEPA